jgi:hypothetical protein
VLNSSASFIYLLRFIIALILTELDLIPIQVVVLFSTNFPSFIHCFCLHGMMQVSMLNISRLFLRYYSFSLSASAA